MRYRIITAGMLALRAFGASAQTVDKRPSLEPAHSPFTYEVLGATPSLQLGKRKASDSETKLAAARESKSRSTTGASSPRDESATVESACAFATRYEAVRSSLMSLNTRNDSSPPYTAADEEIAKLSF